MRGTESIMWRISPGCGRGWGGNEYRVPSTEYRVKTILSDGVACGARTAGGDARRSMRLWLGDRKFPKKIAGGFAGDGEEAAYCSLGEGVGTWGDEDLDALPFEQFANAKNVVGVADRQRAMHAVHPHDDADPFGRFGGVGALGFGDQVALRDTTVA